MAEEKKVINKKEESKKSNNVLALLGFIFSLTYCLSLPGLILSIIGLTESKKYKNDKKGLAIAGIIISSFLMLFTIGLALSGNTTTTEPSNSDNTESSETVKEKKKEVDVVDFSSMSKSDVETWCKNNNIDCSFETDYSDTVAKDGFISQSVAAGQKVEESDSIKIVYSLGHKKTDAEIEAEFKAGCENLDYREVLRTPSNYSYRKAYWFGKVSQVVSSGYSKEYMIYVNCEENSYASGGYICDDPIYVTYSGTSNLIEDDVVDMWGTMATKAYTYTTVLGASKTVPEFNAKYINIR